MVNAFEMTGSLIEQDAVDHISQADRNFPVEGTSPGHE